MTSARTRGGSEARAARVCVGIATRGRPEQLAAILNHLSGQTITPHAIVVCCTEPETPEWSPTTRT